MVLPSWLTSGGSAMGDGTLGSTPTIHESANLASTSQQPAITSSLSMMPMIPPPHMMMPMMSQPPPMQMSMQMPLQMPLQMPMTPLPILPVPGLPRTSSSSSSQGERTIDPSNDVSNWSEHTTNDGRKYWYNKAIAQSTFEKPLVLKTPEERSIPPCKWKEYSTPDGKKYYSDGASSLWTPPEEYLAWKEKIDQIELKAKTAPILSTNSNNTNGSTIPSNGNMNYQTNPDLNYFDTAAVSRSSSSSYHKATKSDEVTIPVFATREEAVVAFKALLEEKKVSVTANIRTVTEACQSDGRWFALKTTGERKQALTEYQTQQQKIEREIQRTKDKKARDSFFMMLAENTDIHSRTRWRDASLLLQDDVRFKNVVDDREREDLFNDFVLELEKKEKDDKAKQRGKVLSALSKLIDNMYDSGSITHKSTWNEIKGPLLQRTQGPEFRVLSESDIRRHVEDFLKKQEAVFKEKERLEREQLESELMAMKVPFETYLLTLVAEGKINTNSRWRDLLEQFGIENLNSYQSLLVFYQDKGLKTLGVAGEPRDVFDAILVGVRDDFKMDRRLVKDFVYDTQLDILPDTSFSELTEAIHKFICGLTGVTEKSHKSSGTKSSSDTKRSSIQQEEGEEVEDTLNRARDMYSTKLKEMMSSRPANLKLIFDDLVLDAVEEFKEEQKRMARKMERFTQLLEEYFYRSDHVGTSWSDAKKSLSKHSAYDDLPKAERKRLFKEYMAALETKIPTKLKDADDGTEVGKKRKLDE